MTRQKTMVTLLLDRTGSMSTIKDDTIGGFNTYVDTLKRDAAGLIDFTFVQFDSISTDKIYVGVPIEHVAHLNGETYVPRGNTPLIDAAYQTIQATEAVLVKRHAAGEDKPKVVVAIQTDGQENCSTKHTWTELNLLIKLQTERGWQFVFMGAGIDAYQQGRKMGISAESTVAYDRRNTYAVMDSLAVNTASFGRGMSAGMNYSHAQKQSAGDVFDPDMLNKTTWDPTKPKGAA